jgi:hypothetical protein
MIKNFTVRQIEQSLKIPNTLPEPSSALEKWYASVRDKRVVDFEIRDLCIACRQNLYPEYVVPVVLCKLSGEPFLREEFPQIRGEEAEALAQKLDEKELQGLIDKLVPVYEKHMTDKEVSEMLKFYETPIGQKVAHLLPQMREESRRIVQEWKLGLVKKVTGKRDGLIHAVTENDTATEFRGHHT